MPHSRYPSREKRFLATQTRHQLTALVFDVFYDDYDVFTLHIKIKHPCIMPIMVKGAPTSE